MRTRRRRMCKFALGVVVGKCVSFTYGPCLICRCMKFVLSKVDMGPWLILATLLVGLFKILAYSVYSAASLSEPTNYYKDCCLAWVKFFYRYDRVVSTVTSYSGDLGFYSLVQKPSPPLAPPSKGWDST
jgi:hypothetical protein